MTSTEEEINKKRQRSTPSIIVNVLIYSRDLSWLSRAEKGFSSLQLSNEFGLTFVFTHEEDKVMKHVKEDGDLQIILIDWYYGSTCENIIKTINSYRPEISVYISLSAKNENEKVEELLSSDLVDGYFEKEEEDYSEWFRIFQAEIAESASTPFYDSLKHYVKLAKDSFHTPGHSGGDSFRQSPWVSDFYDFVGEEILRADLSVSVPSLDSLLQPTGVILQAQKLAARAFGAKESFFVTNGTSTSNKVIIQSVIAPGNKIILDRNCHKSVHHAVILSGASPVYMDSSVNPLYGIFGPVPKQRIYQTLKENRDAKLLVITSCTYDGLRYDLKPIIQAAHELGIKVLIDEAWYAYARFHPVFRPTALECGADFVSQSTHKTLSSLSQGAMIHVNDPNFDRYAFREAFNMFASTSPQYGIIASLDVARKQVSMEGFKLLSQALKLAEELEKNINSTKIFRVLTLEDLLPKEVEEDNVRLDPTKLTIDISKSGLSAEEFQMELDEKYNIQIEKSTFSTVTLLITIGTTRSKASRLYDALLRISKQVLKQSHKLIIPLDLPHFSSLGCLPRDAYFVSGKRVSLLTRSGQPNQEEIVGKISCDQLTPYPPGIPVCVSGQIISDEILHYLIKLTTFRGVEIHGLTQEVDGYFIRVVTDEEAKNISSKLLKQ